MSDKYILRVVLVIVFVKEFQELEVAESLIIVQNLKTNKLKLVQL